jgi:hypothetical protein
MVGVNTHPLPQKMNLYNSRFVDLGLLTNNPFEVAYQAAERFCDLLQKRTGSADFMKSLVLQRICSSFASGLSTATTMLQRTELEDQENDEVQDSADKVA